MAWTDKIALRIRQGAEARVAESAETLARLLALPLSVRHAEAAKAAVHDLLSEADRVTLYKSMGRAPLLPPPPAMPPVVAGSTRVPVVSQGPVLDLDRLPGWASAVRYAVAVRERVMGLVREHRDLEYALDARDRAVEAWELVQDWWSVPMVRKAVVGAVGLVALAWVWGSVPPFMHTVEPSKDGFFYRSFDDGRWHSFPNPHLPQPSVEQPALRDGFIQYGNGSPAPTPPAPQAAVPAVPKIAARDENPLALPGPVYEPPPPPAPRMPRAQVEQMKELIEQAMRPAPEPVAPPPAPSKPQAAPVQAQPPKPDRYTDCQTRNVYALPAHAVPSPVGCGWVAEKGYVVLRSHEAKYKTFTYKTGIVSEKEYKRGVPRYADPAYVFYPSCYWLIDEGQLQDECWKKPGE